MGITNHKYVKYIPDGWLLVFCIYKLLGVPIDIGYIVINSGFRENSAPTPDQSVISSDIIIAFLSVAAVLTGIFLIIRRHQFAPRFWFIFLCIATLLEIQEWFRYPDQKIGIVLVGCSIAWCTYWYKSKKVAVVFGRNGGW
jgi:hypothetical protein